MIEDDNWKYITEGWYTQLYNSIEEGLIPSRDIELILMLIDAGDDIKVREPLKQSIKAMLVLHPGYPFCRCGQHRYYENHLTKEEYYQKIAELEA
mgnify:CR=1 FL=1